LGGHLQEGPSGSAADDQTDNDSNDVRHISVPRHGHFCMFFAQPHKPQADETVNYLADERGKDWPDARSTITPD